MSPTARTIAGIPILSLVLIVMGAALIAALFFVTNTFLFVAVGMAATTVFPAGIMLLLDQL